MALLKEKTKELKATQKKLKKVEEKFVDLHKQQKKLVQDRETFIQFLHLVFPASHLEELLLPDDQLGLYDIDHLRNFWTLYKNQTDQESMHIIQVLREEKQLMFTNLQKLEKEQESKEYLERRVMEMDVQMNKIQEEIQSYIKKVTEKDLLIKQQEEQLRSSKSVSDRIRDLERENSELKAKQLMSSLGNNIKPNRQAENQLQSLQVQLSEKTNEILRLKEENDSLKQQLEDQTA